MINSSGNTEFNYISSTETDRLLRHFERISQKHVEMLKFKNGNEGKKLQVVEVSVDSEEDQYHPNNGSPSSSSQRSHPNNFDPQISEAASDNHGWLDIGEVTVNAKLLQNMVEENENMSE